MLRLLDVYTVAEGFTDHPVYGGERYRQGPHLRVDGGTKVRPLYLLKASEHVGDSHYMAQLINEDGTSGEKVRIFDGDLLETRAEPEPSARIVIQDTVWELNPFTSPPAEQAARPNEPRVYFYSPTSGSTSYINTADSILREDNE